MKALKLVRLMGALTVMASAPVLLAVAAHAQAPTAPPVDAQPGTMPDRPKLPQQIEPVRPGLPPSMDQKPAAGTAGQAPSADSAKPGAKKPAMIGLTVFGSDGQKIGEVRDVKSAPDGKVAAIHIKTGGLLGFGGRTVAIPAGKFNQSGENVQLAMTSDDVAKLPRVEDKPS